MLTGEQFKNASVVYDTLEELNKERTRKDTEIFKGLTVYVNENKTLYLINENYQITPISNIINFKNLDYGKSFRIVNNINIDCNDIYIKLQKTTIRNIIDVELNDFAVCIKSDNINKVGELYKFNEDMKILEYDMILL